MRTNIPIDEKVKVIIAEQLCWEYDDIQDTTKFGDDMGADSLDVTEMVMALEEEFDIQITDEEAEAVVTVADAVQLVQRKKGM